MSLKHLPPPKARKHTPRPKQVKTAVQRQETLVKKKLATAKLEQRRAEKKLAQLTAAKVALTGGDSTIIDEGAVASLAPTAQAYIATQETAFKPNPGPQTEFLAATEREVLFGGSAGGSKTIGIIIDPLRYCGNPHANTLIIRRTSDELREILHKTMEFYPKAFPGAKFSVQKGEWRFPSGARVWLTYLEQDKDVMRYQGQAFTHISIDELTQYPTPFAWDYLRSRLRTAHDVPLYMRASSNPGGPGHAWVKKMFIDPAPPGQAFWATDIETGEPLIFPKNHARAGEPLFKRRFIPARLSDNPYLYDSGDYEAMLLSLPEIQRKRLLEGSWDIAEGAAFPEFDRRCHEVEYFRPPAEWRRFRAADYGYGSAAGCLWFAVDSDNIVYIYRELYTKHKTADVFARMVLEAEQGDRISYGVLDSSLFHKRGDTGPSLAETMILEGCRWKPADRSPGSRINGKNEVHRRLMVEAETGYTRLKIMNNCRHLLSQLPIIPLDPDNPEDVDTRAEDHLYDALRYGLMSRPMPKRHFFDNNDITRSPGFTPSDPTMGY